MQKTEKFFIFSWKELTVIVMLFAISVAFFFTLGLHYGKKIALTPEATEVSGKLETSPETLPSRETLEQGSQHAHDAVRDTLKATTEAEVSEADLKVDAPKPVDLPSEVAKPEVTATAAPETFYAVQLGSYPSKKEAQLKIKSLNKRGLSPVVRTAEVAGQVRYRVVLTGFKSRALADQKAKELKSKQKIESYVIIKSE